MDTQTTTTQNETQFVLRRLEEALRFFGRESDPFWFWIIVLTFVLGAGLFYVCLMYRKDSRSVGWVWASFLALLRGTVYLILAAVFLLPAEQTWEKTQLHSKVILVNDVSGSMGSKDDLPSETVSVDKLLTRQEKVIDFFTDERPAFLKNLTEKNPVYAYRFGNRVDEELKVFKRGTLLSKADWSTWLKPLPPVALPESATDEEKVKWQKRMELHQNLIGGTNLADALKEVLNRESNNMVQGIIVVSDGRNTQFSTDVFDDVVGRSKRNKIPIFTVAVGEHRQPVSIRITDLQTPEQARPDDKFPVRVQIEGDGLPNREMVVTLKISGPKGEQKSLEKPFKFNAGSGGPPNAQVEFEIDAAQLDLPSKDGAKAELEEGNWTLVASVPKEKREIFLEKEHVSNKQTVRVIKRPLRVLMFAGAPTHEFQFVRSMLVREVDQRRAELSICLQLQRPGIIMDVPPERLLRSFPHRLTDDSVSDQGEDRYYSLAHYDLVIAFDPDWSLLQPEQLRALERWVNIQSGGLVLVAGPVNTYQLSRVGNREQLKPILDLFPVTLQDSRLSGLGVDRPTTDPWRLNFPGATKEMDFLRLDDSSQEPLAGWEEFFTGKPPAESNKETPVIRGFYGYYPVDTVKPSANVVATYSDPRARLREGNREQPYIVTMPYGGGKVVYIGSGETRRLRQYREVFHERFWVKLGRYAGAGNLTKLTRHGVLVMGQEFTAGQFVRVEARLFGRDLKPLSPNAAPKIQVKPPAGVTMPVTQFEMAAKPTQGDEWTGWFQGRFRVTSPGEYNLDLQIPESGETLPKRFMVKESNPELENTRPDFGQLYQLSSEITDYLPRMDKEAQDEVRRALAATAGRLTLQSGDGEGEQKPAGDKGVTKATPPTAGGEIPRLFFDLGSASLIPKCMVTESKVQRSRGPVKDLWDDGYTLSESHNLRLATVLIIIVGLLSIEWLTRKLLRLA